MIIGNAENQGIMSNRNILTNFNTPTLHIISNYTTTFTFIIIRIENSQINVH